jgi:hypothetical protein
MPGNSTHKRKSSSKELVESHSPVPVTKDTLAQARGGDITADGQMLSPVVSRSGGVSGIAIRSLGSHDPGWGCDSVVESLCSMCKALGSILSTAKKKSESIILLHLNAVGFVLNIF